MKILVNIKIILLHVCMYVCMYIYYLSQHENFGHIEIILHFDAEQHQFEYSAMIKVIDQN